MFPSRAGLGPFLYCDYWASVLGLDGIVSPAAVADGRVSLGHFRRAIDRPRTRLPKLRYYILAFIFLPVLMPYRVVYDLMRLFRGRAERLAHPVDAVMVRYGLHLEPAAAGWVRVTTGARTSRGRTNGAGTSGGGTTLADDLIDPGAVRCEVSLFFPTYKLLLAGLLSLVISAGLLPQLDRVALLAPLGQHLDTVLYGLLAVVLLLVLRDPLTAFVAPLPILAFHVLWRRPDSPGELLLASAGFVVLFFLVEWLLIPRGLPPTLFLYVNEPESRAFPYRAEHAPSWLRGRHYWVWRFVSLVPGELHKFWERDWERIECWVRADGPEAGRLEWVVGDAHYRELWYEVERLAPVVRRQAQEQLLAARARPGAAATSLVWSLEVDMDPIFHAPYVRGLFLLSREELGWRQRLRRLGASLAGGMQRDRYRRFAARLDELEVAGPEIFGDVPEHFRRLALHQVIGLPWSYWRYPFGAGATARRFVYGGPGLAAAVSAADPAYQIKQVVHEMRAARRRLGDAKRDRGRSQGGAAG